MNRPYRFFVMNRPYPFFVMNCPNENRSGIARPKCDVQFMGMNRPYRCVPHDVGMAKAKNGRFRQWKSPAALNPG